MLPCNSHRAFDCTIQAANRTHRNDASQHVCSGRLTIEREPTFGCPAPLPNIDVGQRCVTCPNGGWSITSADLQGQALWCDSLYSPACRFHEIGVGNAVSRSHCWLHSPLPADQQQCPLSEVTSAHGTHDECQQGSRKLTHETPAAAKDRIFSLKGVMGSVGTRACTHMTSKYL